MTEQEMQPVDAEASASEKEEFTPTGSLALTIGYIIVFAIAWGLIYFDLLARR